MSGPVEWLVPAVAAQLLFASAVFIDKYVLSKFDPDPRSAALVSSALNLVVAVVLLAWRGPVDGSMADNALLFGAGAMLALYLVPYFRALALADASTVAPLFQFFPVLVFVIAILLGDGTSLWHVVGLGITVASSELFLLADGGGRSLMGRLVRLMLVASAILAVQAVVVDDVLTRHSFLDSLPMISAGLGLTGLVGFWATPFASRLSWSKLGPRGLLSLLCAELFALTADFLLVAALAVGPVVLVTMTTSLEPLVLFAMGALLTVVGPGAIRESLSRRTVSLKLAGCVLAVTGVTVTLL